MTSNDLEKFDKMKTAGNLAARTLDLITEYIKPGITTSDIDKLIIREISIYDCIFFTLMLDCLLI